MSNMNKTGLQYKTHLEIAECADNLKTRVDEQINALSTLRGFELVGVSIAYNSESRLYIALISYKVSTPPCLGMDIKMISNAASLITVASNNGITLNDNDAIFMMQYLNENKYVLFMAKGDLYVHDDQYGKSHLRDQKYDFIGLVRWVVDMLGRTIADKKDQESITSLRVLQVNLQRILKEDNA